MLLLQMPDIKTILEYYSILNLCSLPITIGIISILHKKTNWLDPIDKFIDEKLLGKAPKEEVPDRKKKTEEVKKSEEENKEVDKKPKYIPDEYETLWDKNQLNMTCINLRVGDTYRCRLNEYDLMHAGSGPKWKISDEFVGEINEKGSFSAKKVGYVYVEFGEARLYYMNIEPTISHEAGICCDDIIRTRVRDSILARLAKKGIQPEYIDEESRQFCIKNNKMSILYSTETDGTIDKCLIRMKNTEQNRKEIKSIMKERMKVAYEQDKQIFWIHFEPNIIRPQLSVDVTAFMKQSTSGDLIFGITRSWRIGCPESEALANIEMTIQMFKNILNKSDIPVNIKERQLPPEKKTNKKKKQDNKSDNQPKNDSENSSEQNNENSSENKNENNQENTETPPANNDSSYPTDPMDEPSEENPDQNFDIEDPTV